ncbi:Gfo/Idh/MocA family oxidoreductase [Candidatus Gottesmanbacteria bacterium]|nr:Gfo/Idh/MocA family oxidoreductase [Candidatus Gottesmanbacteria bacterium]
MTGNIRFALIGAGRMGKRWASVLSKCDAVSLATIATRDIETILNDKTIDAVLIATPHSYLSPITSAALKAGKHVLCEKPGAIKSVEIKKNSALARKKRLTYMIGYNHRFHDAFIRARQLYEKGYIGKLTFIRARYGFGGRIGYDREWRFNKAISGGGHLIDQGVHMIDLTLSFMGKVTGVRGFISDTFWKPGVEDNAFVLLQGKNRALTSIHVSLTQWKPIHNFEMYGAKGYISIEGLGQKYGGGETLVIGKRADDFTSQVKEKVIVCNSIADDSLALELAEFVSSIREGRPTIPSPSDAYETLKIVEKIYRMNKL